MDWFESNALFWHPQFPVKPDGVNCYLARYYRVGGPEAKKRFGCALERA